MDMLETTRIRPPLPVPAPAANRRAAAFAPRFEKRVVFLLLYLVLAVYVLVG